MWEPVIYIPVGDWSANTSEVIGNIPSPGVIASPYLKVTIGGGGFRR